MLSRFLEYVLQVSRNAELLIVSGAIAVLSLALPLYVIQALTRYLSNGVDETLYSLTVGVLIALVIEFLLRQFRRKAIAHSINQDQDIYRSIEALSKVNFESEKSSLYQICQEQLGRFAQIWSQKIWIARHIFTICRLFQCF